MSLKYCLDKISSPLSMGGQLLCLGCVSVLALKWLEKCAPAALPRKAIREAKSKSKLTDCKCFLGRVKPKLNLRQRLEKNPKRDGERKEMYTLSGIDRPQLRACYKSPGRS